MGAEHVLHALIEHGAAWRVRLPPPCREELRAFVEQELDRLPAENAYRDAAAPALSKEVVDALRPSRWTIFERALGPKELTQRVSLIPRVRDWISWASMDDLLVDEAIDEAKSLAGQRGHLSVSVPHFLRVIAEQHWLGASPRLAKVLDEQLEKPMRGHDQEPSLGEDLALLVAKSKVYARMAQRPATSDMLLAIALREDLVTAIFEEAGIPTAPLLQFLAHGTRSVPDDPESGTVDVYFENDDFTPVEVVRDLMAAHFGLTASEAKEKVATAHEEGRVVLGRFDAEEGRTRTEHARLAARQARFPLRIVLVAI